LVNPFSWFLRATGQVGRSLKIAFMICPVVIVGIVAGLHYGPPGVAFGYSTAMVLLFVPIVAWATYGTGITAHAYWHAIKHPLISGGIAGACGWLVQIAFHGALPPIPLLALEAGISFAVYAGVLLFVMGQKDLYCDLLGELFHRQPAKADAAVGS